MLKNNRQRISFLLGMITLSLLLISACGGFGGRYKIDSKPMDEFFTNKKIPINVKLVLDSELCNYVYISKRQGAKRVFELGEALCSDTKNLFSTLFEIIHIVSKKDDYTEGHINAVVIPKVIDTSALVRPGAPPNFEATIVYECTIEDENGRTIFVRTIKENKVLKTFGYDAHKTVMQETVDELFAKLENELVNSPEIKKFANSFK